MLEGWKRCVRPQGFCELAEFTVSSFHRIPFSENDAAFGAKHEQRWFAFVPCSEGEIRRSFASGAHENQRTISSLHSRQVHFDHVSTPCTTLRIHRPLIRSAS